MRDLVFAVQNMQEALAHEAEELVLERAEPDDVLRLCAMLRRIGCGRFLADGDAAPLLRGLRQSAELWHGFLEAGSARGRAVEVARSRSAPMTDAILAGAEELARRIDTLLPRAQVPDLEDGEDFAWADALHGVAVGRLDGSGLAMAADALLATGSDFLAPRGALLRAIRDGDGSAFGDALRQLADTWHSDVEEARDAGITELAADLTEWNIFLEGAALVRIARDRGVPVEPFYPFIPAELLAELAAEGRR